MGVSNSTYVGVYLEIPYFKSEVKVITYKHPLTGYKMSKKFCPETGIEGLVVERTDIHYIRPNAYIDKDGFNEDMFFSPEYTFNGERTQTVILNGSSKFGCELGECENFVIGEVDVDNIIISFTKTYKKYLAHFNDEYGDFKILYGVVNYSH
jgi:hypothetical protein